MPASKPKGFPFTLDQIDRLIKMLELFDTGLIAEKVAIEMKLAQPLVSRKKGALVELLNDPLLKDGGPNGKQLTERARMFLDSLRESRKLVVAALSSEPFGPVELRVGSIPSVLTSFMPEVFRRLMASDYFGKYPYVSLRTESGPASELFERLDRDLLDLVIAYPLRDTNLNTRPPKKRGEQSGGGWHPVQFNPWIRSSDIQECELFVGRPVGLIYHEANEAMEAAAAKKSSFSFRPLESMILFLTSDPNQPAFEAEIEKWLPVPKPKEGARIYMQSFNQIRAALTHGGPDLQRRAVGVGADLGDEKKLRFLNFADVAKKIRPEMPDAPAVQRLAQLTTQKFFFYRKAAKARPAVAKEYFRAFTACVEVAAQPGSYTHSYVS